MSDMGKKQDVMNKELRKAALIVFDRKSHDIERVMVFEDHNDAVDVWKELPTTKNTYIVLSAIEYYDAGQKPGINEGVNND